MWLKGKTSIIPSVILFLFVIFFFVLVLLQSFGFDFVDRVFGMSSLCIFAHDHDAILFSLIIRYFGLPSQLCLDQTLHFFVRSLFLV